MADNYLITGYWGEPHVTAENDRGINAAIFGAGRLVLPVGEQFRAEYIGNNTVRIYDGKLIDNGAVAGIPAGEYVDLLIPEAGQGKKRNDLIIFQYSQDPATLVERGVFVVLSGNETSGTAIDPALSQQDILTNEATLDQMALWRVPVSGTVISAPVQLFEVSKNIKNAGVSVVEATSSDGVAYSATVPGVTELYAGLEVTIIPNMASASTGITLDINGLGAKFVRLPVSTNTAILAQPDNETYFVESRPVRLMYDPKYAGKGSWVAVCRQRQSGNDLYGSVPVQKGGWFIDNNTTDEDKAEALENLLEIGLAPGGYGLGEDSGNAITTLAQLDAVKVNSFRNYYGEALPVADAHYSNTSQGGVLTIYGHGCITQYFFLRYPSRGSVLKRYTTTDGSVWESWEWVNPPMNPGEEYRTTERYLGKPVFVKVFDFGALPNATFKNIDHNLKPTAVVSLTGCSKDGKYYLPCKSNTEEVGLYINGGSIQIKTDSNWSSISAYVTVKYTKD